MAIQADATLVSASMKMGQALVPADTSKMFKQQFEALGKMHKAKAKMYTSGIVLGGKLLQKGIDKLSKNATERKAKKAEFEKRAEGSIEGGNYGDNKRELANTLKEKQEPVTRTPEEIEGIQGDEINVGTTSRYGY